MKKRIIWHIMKCYIKSTPLAKTLNKVSDDIIIDLYETALDREQYDIAAILKYYTEFKRGYRD